MPEKVGVSPGEIYKTGTEAHSPPSPSLVSLLFSESYLRRKRPVRGRSRSSMAGENPPTAQPLELPEPAT